MKHLGVTGTPTETLTLVTRGSPHSRESHRSKDDRSKETETESSWRKRTGMRDCRGGEGKGDGHLSSFIFQARSHAYRSAHANQAPNCSNSSSEGSNPTLSCSATQSFQPSTRCVSFSIPVSCLGSIDVFLQHQIQFHLSPPSSLIPTVRDPRKGWWDVKERRNFGEPVRLIFSSNILFFPCHSFSDPCLHLVVPTIHQIPVFDEFTGPYGPEYNPATPWRLFFYAVRISLCPASTPVSSTTIADDRTINSVTVGRSLWLHVSHLRL